MINLSMNYSLSEINYNRIFKIIEINALIFYFNDYHEYVSFNYY
jgi:hypothetical protein